MAAAIWPELVLVGRNPAKLARDRRTARPDRVDHRPRRGTGPRRRRRSTSTRRSPSGREKALRAAIAAGKHIYTEKPLADGHGHRARTGPGRPRRRDQARRRAGQAVPARAAQAASGSSTAASSAGFCRYGASSATGSSKATGRPPSARRGTTAPPTAAASCWTCSRTGTTCWSSCSARSGRCTAHVATHIPRRVDESGRPIRRDRRRRRVRHLRARRRRRRADQLVLGGAGLPRRAGRVPGRRHPRHRRSPACATAASSTGPPRPKPVWNPDLPVTEDFRAQWQRGAGQRADFDNGFKVQWERVPAARRRTAPSSRGTSSPAPAGSSSPSSACGRPARAGASRCRS